MSQHQRPAASIDLRGFRHALAPHQQRRQWQLDALQLAFSRARQAITEKRQALLDLQGQRRRVATGLTSLATHHGIDPHRYGRTLHYLAALQAQAHRLEQEITALDGNCQQLLQQVRQRQREVDLLQQHREACVLEYAGEADRLAAAQADRDWSARQAPATALALRTTPTTFGQPGKRGFR